MKVTYTGESKKTKDVKGNEVNLENLSDSLLGVIEDTLHPATSSLWLRGK